MKDESTARLQAVIMISTKGYLLDITEQVIFFYGAACYVAQVKLFYRSVYLRFLKFGLLLNYELDLIMPGISKS